MRRTLGLVAIAASLALPRAASAQGTPDPEAVRLFLEGKKHRDEGRCDLAIPELRESVKHEPSIGAHYNLGVCYEKTNKRLALESYNKALAIAKQRGDDREREIRAQVADFLDKTPHLRLALPKPVPPDLNITVDGEAIPSNELQSETIYFVQGGKPSYTVVATASGYQDTRLTVDESAVKKRDLVTLVLRKEGEAAPAPPAPPADNGGGFTWQHGTGIAGIVLGAAGVTYASVGAIAYSIEEDNLFDKFSSACNLDGNPDCSPTERNTRDDLRGEYKANEDSAKSQMPVWLATGIGGVLLIGGGVFLLVTAPSMKAPDDTPMGKVRVVPTVGATFQGMSLTGTF